jgi:multifunctional beta-oxidation protein
LCHEACTHTGWIWGLEEGHVQAYRWQLDEAFVKVDVKKTEDSLESVANQWPAGGFGKFEKVGYAAKVIDRARAKDDEPKKLGRPAPPAPPMQMPLRFDHRVAIVTGVTKTGVGSAYCKFLASRGAKVIVHGPSSREVELVVSDIIDAGGEALGETTDLSRGNMVVETAITNYDRLDIVVVCLPDVDHIMFDLLSLSEVVSTLDAVVVGHFLLLKEAWMNFYMNRFGRVVFVVNSTAYHGGVGKTLEGAIGGAFTTIAQTLGMEGYRYDIKANVISVAGIGKASATTEVSTVPVAYLCHEQCKATAGIFHAESDGDVKSLRWQADEDFVDFDPRSGDGALDEVAEKWLGAPRFSSVSYPGTRTHMSYR